MEKTANALALLRQASFIRQADDFGDVVPVFKKTVWADKPVSRAILHVTALGFYEAYLNGGRVGRFIFAPGWTVASLWELYSPQRTDSFLMMK